MRRFDGLEPRLLWKSDLRIPLLYMTIYAKDKLIFICFKDFCWEMWHSFVMLLWYIFYLNEIFKSGNWGVTLSPISGLIIGPLPHQVVLLLGFTSPVVWLLGFPPSVVWLLGFTPPMALTHQRFDYWTLPPQVVCLKGFTHTIFSLISSNVIPIEDCRVFVLRRRATSYFTCPILPHQSYKYIII